MSGRDNREAQPTDAARRALIETSRGYSEAQLTLIKEQIAPGASDLELAYFLQVCQITGLNPLQRQIYAIMRDQRQSDGTHRKRMTIQTGIDGYRLLAVRTGALAGIEDAEYGPETKEGYPAWARVTVWRFVGTERVPFTATARWREYVQSTKDGKPTSMWVKMPFLMLGKCAEALALRKAFPAELSGIYTPEEMDQADSETMAPTVADAGTVVESNPAPAATPTQPQEPKRWTLAELKKRADALGLTGPEWGALVQRCKREVDAIAAVLNTREREAREALAQQAPRSPTPGQLQEIIELCQRWDEPVTNPATVEEAEAEIARLRAIGERIERNAKAAEQRMAGHDLHEIGAGGKGRH